MGWTIEIVQHAPTERGEWRYIRGEDGELHGTYVRFAPEPKKGFKGVGLQLQPGVQIQPAPVPAPAPVPVPVGGENGDLPESMLDVAGMLAGLDNAPTSVSRRPSFLEPVGRPVAQEPQPGEPAPKVPVPKEPPPKEPLGELAGIVDNKEVGIDWNSGVRKQGLPWQAITPN